MSKGAGRVSGLGDSDGPCRIARYPRRRPGIPPPRLRSAPPFDKGGFSRGLRPRKRLPSQGSWPSLRGLRGFDGLYVATRQRATSAHCKGAGCRPPSPLSSATRSRHPVGAGHARPAALPLPPVYLLHRRGGIHPSRAVCAAANLRGASGTPPPTMIRKAAPYRKRARRPGGRPPYIPLFHSS